MDSGVAQLVKWATQHGATRVVCSGQATGQDDLAGLSGESSQELAPLMLATFPEAGGRGLAATRNLQAGELLLSVPEKLLMTARSAQEDPQLGAVLRRCPALTSSQTLTVHLLHEVSKGAASFWRPYLLQLPRTHHTLALFPEAAVAELQVPEAIQTARTARAEAHRDWMATRRVLHELGLPRKFTRFLAWLWAAATVNSRTVAMPFDPAGALCPVGDLFNYAAPSATDESVRLSDGGFDEDTQSFCFYARENYMKGQQVLLCYGCYRNLDLLQHYGFVFPNNQNDAASVPLPATLYPAVGSDAVGEQDCGLETRPDCCLEADGRPSFRLLSILRLRAASPGDRKKFGHLASAGLQISIEGDVSVYTWIRNISQALLGKLPTSLTFDLALKEANEVAKVKSDREHENGSDWTSNSVHRKSRSSSTALQETPFSLALYWRIGYKKILNLAAMHATRQLENSASLLQGSYKQPSRNA